MINILTLLTLFIFSGQHSFAKIDPTKVFSLNNKKECEKLFGSYEKAGMLGFYYCFLPTSDGGQECDRATDCEGACFSKNRECSKKKPLFGCYGFLDDKGGAYNICAD